MRYFENRNNSLWETLILKSFHFILNSTFAFHLSILTAHGRNLTLLRYPQFLRLVQVGLPNLLRGEIWELTSGSIYNRFSNRGEYQRILKENEGRVSTSTEEIEKDLNRSLPEYQGFQSEVGIGVSRDVFEQRDMNLAKNRLTDSISYSFFLRSFS